MAEAAKRSHDPSTGDTPGKKPEKRRSIKSARFVKDAKKSLFQSDTEPAANVERKYDAVRNITCKERKIYFKLTKIEKVSLLCIALFQRLLLIGS